MAVEARLIFFADRGSLGRLAGGSALRKNGHEEEWQGRKDEGDETKKDDLLGDAYANRRHAVHFLIWACGGLCSPELAGRQRTVGLLGPGVVVLLDFVDVLDAVAIRVF
jgi:hypothetical protein